MKLKLKTAFGLATSVIAVHAAAAVTIIPDASLTPSTSLYTNNYGNVVVSTGGGNAANVGQADGRNDDGFGGSFNLGYTLSNFFGGNYSSFYVNTNGNITFTAGLSQFTPSGPQGATQPVIAPYFADVDTRGLASGVVHLNQLTTNETVVTWDHVGYYSEADNHLATFQLVLRGPDFSIPAGQGQIGFFWGDVQWETGGASGGSDGFGGSPAAVGFGDGLSNGFVLESSQHNGVSSVVSNHSIWFNLSDVGTPVAVTPVNAVPEPSTYALMFAGLAAVGFMSRRRRQRV